MIIASPSPAASAPAAVRRRDHRGPRGLRRQVHPHRQLPDGQHPGHRHRRPDVRLSATGRPAPPPTSSSCTPVLSICFGTDCASGGPPPAPPPPAPAPAARAPAPAGMLPPHLHGRGLPQQDVRPVRHPDLQCRLPLLQPQLDLLLRRRRGHHLRRVVRRRWASPTSQAPRLRPPRHPRLPPRRRRRPRRHIKTVFLILMENTNWSDIKGSSAAPLHQQHAPAHGLLRRATTATRRATTPASRTTSGSKPAPTSASQDDNPPSANHQSTTQHLVTQLKAAGITWKAYQEDITGTDLPADRSAASTRPSTSRWSSSTT